MSSIRYLSDLPDPAKEIAKCREFLSEFVDDAARSYKYMEVLVSELISYHFYVLTLLVCSKA